MTKSEIIKVLENELECVKRQCGNFCDNKRDCKHCDLVLKDEVIINAYEKSLDLINRKNAEIERLKCEMGKLLPKDCSYAMQMEVSNKLESQIKSEAIKEFAHFVIDRSRNGVIYTSDIPDLVKEMTEIETNQRKEDEGK